MEPSGCLHSIRTFQAVGSDDLMVYISFALPNRYSRPQFVLLLTNLGFWAILLQQPTVLDGPMSQGLLLRRFTWEPCSKSGREGIRTPPPIVLCLPKIKGLLMWKGLGLSVVLSFIGSWGTTIFAVHEASPHSPNYGSVGPVRLVNSSCMLRHLGFYLFGMRNGESGRPSWRRCWLLVQLMA
jgi:hypothetical protein